MRFAGLLSLLLVLPVPEVTGQDVRGPMAPTASFGQPAPTRDAADLVTNAVKDPPLRTLILEVLDRNHARRARWPPR